MGFRALKERVRRKETLIEKKGDACAYYVHESICVKNKKNVAIRYWIKRKFW